MSAQNSLPLLDLSTARSSLNRTELQRGIRRYGAFRLLAPGIFRAFARAIPHGYSPFGSELIRGKRRMPKESVYFYRQRDQNTPSSEPPAELSGSIIEILEAWHPLRNDVFEVLSNEILNTTTDLTSEPLFEYETMALHYYVSHKLVTGERDYSPAHKDGGLLTILVRGMSGPDGLEVADLESTNEVDSGKIGLEASFVPVPVIADEVVVFLGTRIQRLIGDQARACVHRVSAFVQDKDCPIEERLSVAIFCAPPI
ncbi:uncharacterized protein N7483_013091 [Penicillium malachiteum]|uniref:uncharacterized protein n=1 Tax=Penicillium malachiteum TaxID=1324776 RepID=UPI0025476C81|nr:uncharacterized protein N7483_013091 [Penicillium malachiteum]KAJ5715910.1 hypothetical protein N7483_013091 [Penicillium malachiteum]